MNVDNVLQLKDKFEDLLQAQRITLKEYFKRMQNVSFIYESIEEAYKFCENARNK